MYNHKLLLHTLSQNVLPTGINAGGCSNNTESFATNPQYMITLTDSDEDEDDLCNCIISVLQKGTRGFFCEGQTSQCLYIGQYANIK